VRIVAEEIMRALNQTLPDVPAPPPAED
jgi:hypothetical protein